MCNARSRSSKVVDLSTSRKRVCNFLLVINSNLSCSYLVPFRHSAGFLLRTAETLPLFHPNFGVFPLYYIADDEVSRTENAKIIVRVIIFEVTQSIRPRSLDVTDGRTDI